LGQAVNRYVSEGRLVPDALVVKVMTGRLTSRLLARGFVLDGFPRTVGQAEGLDRFLASRRRPLDGALYLACPARVLVVRLTGRQVCRHCGTNYHVRTMRPKREGRCDRCGGALIVRKDDQAATVRKRLVIDRTQAKPLLAYYRLKKLLARLDGTGSSAAVLRRTLHLVGRRGWMRHDRAQDR